MATYSYLLALLLLSGTSTTTITVNETNCRKVAKQIKQVESLMRQGYTVKQGEKLMKRLRVLKKHRYMCSKARLATK